MGTRLGLSALALALGFALGGCKANAPEGAGRREALYIENVRLFDGEVVRPRVTVVLRAGRVFEVGEVISVPPGAARLNGEGQTLGRAIAREANRTSRSVLRASPNPA